VRSSNGTYSSSKSPIRSSHGTFFNNRIKKFQCGSSTLSGLHLVLKRNFYPDFNFFSAVRTDCDKVAVTTVSSGKKKKTRIRQVPIWIANKRKNTVSSGWNVHSASSSTQVSGKSVGIRLDREVDELVRLVAGERKIPLRSIYYACFPLAGHTEAVRVDTLLWGAQVKALVKFLFNQGWLPSRSQLVVSEPGIGLATALDLLCLDVKERRYVVVECKCGYGSR